MSISDIDTEEIAQEVSDGQTTEETTETVEPQEEVQTEEVQTEETPTETPAQAELNWAEYGLPQWAGKKPDEIAGHIKGFYKKYGELTNELGELRKMKEKFSQVEQTVTEKPKTSEFKKLDETEYKIFAEQFIDDPIGAMGRFVLPQLQERITNQILEQLDEKIRPEIETVSKNLSYDQSFNQFVKANPDWVEHQELMAELMTNQALGEDADFDEVLSLSKLYKSDSKLAAETYQLMKRGFGFNQAKRYATGVVSASGEEAKTKIKQEVGKVRASAPAGVKAGNKGKALETWDDVLDDSMREMGISTE